MDCEKLGEEEDQKEIVVGSRLIKQATQPDFERGCWMKG